MSKLIPTIIGIILLIGLPLLLAYTGVTSLPEWALIIIFIIPPFTAGFIAKSGGDGAISGFLTMFIPILGLGILLILQALGILSAPVSGALEAFVLAFVGILILAVGIAILVFSIVLGIIGAIIGAIAGFISSKIFEE